jgi:hypothetical protein
VERAERLQATPMQHATDQEVKEAAYSAHEGVPDKWTSTGDLVKGTLPDALRALMMYQELDRRGLTEVLERYGRLLEHGVPGYDDVIDHDAALQIYQRDLRAKSLDKPQDRYEALEHVERLLSAGPLRPAEYAQMKQQKDQLRRLLADTIETTVRALRWQEVRPPRTGLPGRAEILGIPILAGRGEIFGIPGRGEILGIPIQATVPPQPLEEGAIRNDLNNTHGSGVTATVKASIENLRGRVTDNNATDIHKSLQDVRQMLQRASGVSHDRRTNAIRALDTIERTNHLLGSVDMREVDLLHLVWNRAHHPDNKDNQDVIKENLLMELLECIEGGIPVCATGRFTRIIDTLNGVDNQVQIRPKWAISQELIEKAKVVRLDEVARLAKSDREAYESSDPDPAQADIADRVTRDVKVAILKDFQKDYMDSGVMTQEALDVETLKWIDHIG